MSTEKVPEPSGNERFGRIRGGGGGIFPHRTCRLVGIHSVGLAAVHPAPTAANPDRPVRVPHRHGAMILAGSAVRVGGSGEVINDRRVLVLLDAAGPGPRLIRAPLLPGQSVGRHGATATVAALPKLLIPPPIDAALFPVISLDGIDVKAVLFPHSPGADSTSVVLASPDKSRRPKARPTRTDRPTRQRHGWQRDRPGQKDRQWATRRSRQRKLIPRLQTVQRDHRGRRYRQAARASRHVAVDCAARAGLGFGRVWRRSALDKGCLRGGFREFSPVSLLLRLALGLGRLRRRNERFFRSNDRRSVHGIELSEALYNIPE